MPGRSPRSKSPRRSPREAGEVGETVDDMLSQALLQPARLARAALAQP